MSRNICVGVLRGVTVLGWSALAGLDMDELPRGSSARIALAVVQRAYGVPVALVKHLDRCRLEASGWLLRVAPARRQVRGES